MKTHEDGYLDKLIDTIHPDEVVTSDIMLVLALCTKAICNRLEAIREAIEDTGAVG